MRKPRLVFEADESLMKQIDDWRYANRAPSTAEAIRRLIVGALRVGVSSRRSGNEGCSIAPETERE